MKFAERYGSWGIVAGASEGVGAAYADQLAAIYPQVRDFIRAHDPG